MKDSKAIKLLSGAIAIIFASTTIVSANPSFVYSLKIPEKHGTVKKRYKGKSDITVIHIRDAHASSEAQKQISKIIDSLSQQGVTLIGVEGAVGAIDVNEFREYPNREANEIVSDNLIKSAIFQAAEHAAVTTEEPVELWGVDDEEKYIQNFRAMQSLLAEENILDDLEEIESILSELKTVLFNEQLDTFDRLTEEYTRTMGEHMIDYYILLATTAEKLGIDTMQYIHFSQFKEVLKQYAQENKKIVVSPRYQDVMREMKEVAYAIKQGMAEFADARELISVIRTITVLKRIITLRAENNDVAYYRAHKGDFSLSALCHVIKKHDPPSYNLIDRQLAVSLDQWLAQAETFYGLAEERSHALSNNVTSAMAERGQKAAVLIAGGYHSDDITDYLQAQDISFVDIMPVLSDVQEDIPYHEIMSGATNPFNLFLAGNTIAIPHALNKFAQEIFGDTRAAQNVQRVYDKLDNLFAETGVLRTIGDAKGINAESPDLKQELEVYYELVKAKTANNSKLLELLTHIHKNEQFLETLTNEIRKDTDLVTETGIDYSALKQKMPILMQLAIRSMPGISKTIDEKTMAELLTITNSYFDILASAEYRLPNEEQQINDDQALEQTEQLMRAQRLRALSAFVVRLSLRMYHALRAFVVNLPTTIYNAITLKWLLLSSDDTLRDEVRTAIDQINDLAEEYNEMDLDELAAKTNEFRERLAQGATLDDLLPEAFAVVREAAWKKIGLRHRDVQLAGGIMMHKGIIAELDTSEGKTLTALLTAYLHALSGRPVFIATANQYLARRDCGWMGAVLDGLGIRVTYAASRESRGEFDANYTNPNEKENHFEHLKQTHNISDVYAQKSDDQLTVIYGTYSQFMFDNQEGTRAKKASDVYQDDLYSLIVDELDDALLDQGITPHIISGKEQKYSDEEITLFHLFAKTIVKNLTETSEGREQSGDYIKDVGSMSVELTERGIEKVTERLRDDYDNRLDTLTNPEFMHLQQYLHNALLAEYVYDKDKHYQIQNNELVLVNHGLTERAMPGQRFQNGLMEAIEAKEEMTIHSSHSSVRSISPHQYFLMFERRTGMTATALDAENELYEMLDIEARSVEKHIFYEAAQEGYQQYTDSQGNQYFARTQDAAIKERRYVRTDLTPRIFETEAHQIEALVVRIKELHRNGDGRPLIINMRAGTDVEALYERLLREKDIIEEKLEMLTAKNEYDDLKNEADIIAQAGKRGAITIATNIAGRGIDIPLGEDVLEIGGLHEIITSMPRNKRVEKQVKGRVARNGVPGSSELFLSLEDPITRISDAHMRKTYALVIADIAGSVDGETGEIAVTSDNWLARMVQQLAMNMLMKYFRRLQQRQANIDANVRESNVHYIKAARYMEALLQKGRNACFEMSYGSLLEKTQHYVLNYITHFVDAHADNYVEVFVEDIDKIMETWIKFDREAIVNDGLTEDKVYLPSFLNELESDYPTLREYLSTFFALDNEWAYVNTVRSHVRDFALLHQDFQAAFKKYNKWYMGIGSTTWLKRRPRSLGAYLFWAKFFGIKGQIWTKIRKVNEKRYVIDAILANGNQAGLNINKIVSELKAVGLYAALDEREMNNLLRTGKIEEFKAIIAQQIEDKIEIMTDSKDEKAHNNVLLSLLNAHDAAIEKYLEQEAIIRTQAGLMGTAQKNPFIEYIQLLGTYYEDVQQTMGRDVLQQLFKSHQYDPKSMQLKVYVDVQVFDNGHVDERQEIFRGLNEAHKNALRNVDRHRTIESIRMLFRTKGITAHIPNSAFIMFDSRSEEDLSAKLVLDGHKAELAWVVMGAPLESTITENNRTLAMLEQKGFHPDLIRLVSLGAKQDAIVEADAAKPLVRKKRRITAFQALHDIFKSLEFDSSGNVMVIRTVKNKVLSTVHFSFERSEILEIINIQKRLTKLKQAA